MEKSAPLDLPPVQSDFPSDKESAPKHKRGLIFLRSFCGSTRLHCHTTPTEALNSQGISCSGGKRFGKCFFPDFVAGFNPGLTCIAVVRTTLVFTQLFKSSIGGI